MKQPNANAKLKLRYRIADKLFRFIKKHSRTILILLVIVLVVFIATRVLSSKIDDLNIFKKISNFFSNTFNNVKVGISNAWNGAKNGVSNAWDSVTGKASDIWSGFTGLFS